MAVGGRGNDDTGRDISTLKENLSCLSDCVLCTRAFLLLTGIVTRIRRFVTARMFINRTSGKATSE